MEIVFTGKELSQAAAYAHDWPDGDDSGVGLMLGIGHFFGAIGEPGKGQWDLEMTKKAMAAHTRLMALAHLAADKRMTPFRLDCGNGWLKLTENVFNAAANCPLTKNRKAGKWARFKSADEFFNILVRDSQAEGRA